MKKNYTFLVPAIIVLGFGSFQTNPNPFPKEKMLRFVDKTDVSGTTITILEKDYTGDLNNLPTGTLSKVDVRLNAQSGEIVERRLLILPK